MLATGVIIQSDVLKIGHHGSSTSTSTEFLNSATPTIAIISVGAENDYGHPHQETLDQLSTKGIKVYTTKDSGTITVIANGKDADLKVKSEKTLVNISSGIVNETKPTVVIPTIEQPINNTQTYYWTPNGKSHHTTDKCSPLSRSKTILSGTLEEAITAGKIDPCDVCN